MSGGIIVDRMSHAEVFELTRWAENEGWIPGVHDADSFFAVDPDGFVAIRRNGELLGGGAVIRHSPRFGFMGLFIVRPEHRGAGIGRKLWFARRDLLLSRLEPNASIGLDAVDAMVNFYAAGGFQPAYRTGRFVFEGDHKFKPREDGDSVRPLTPEDHGQIYALDVFPSSRDAYLRVWLNQPDAIKRVAVDDSGRIEGWAICRPATEGYKLGPLIAGRPDVAERLLASVLADFPGGPVSLYVPLINKRAVQLCARYGMTNTFECTRMIYGPVPSMDIERCYGVTTLELG